MRLLVKLAAALFLKLILVSRSLDNTTSTFLVFNGIDTFSDISFCGRFIGSTDNQFRQWVFDVSQIASGCSGDPRVQVAFTSALAASQQAEAELYCPYCLDEVYQFPNRQFVRKQQSDFGWDWSPAFVPQGIWQPAFLVQLPTEGKSEVYVKNSLVDIYRQGQLNNLPPDQGMPWVVNISIDYIGIKPRLGSLLVEIYDGEQRKFSSQTVSDVLLTDNIIQGNLTLSRTPQLWWPVGHGNQTLYSMEVRVLRVDGSVLTTVTKRIGFRTIVLNQGQITREQQAKGIAPGSNWHFEVNGKAIFCKGSNLVPLDVFWPRVTKGQTRTLLEAAVAGVGPYLQRYSSLLNGCRTRICFEFGLVVFTFQTLSTIWPMRWASCFGVNFVSQERLLIYIRPLTSAEFSDALYPVQSSFLDNVIEEAHYQTRRVNHHPSLALWAGNNEIQLALLLVAAYVPTALRNATQLFEKLFLDVLLHAVFDNSRSISYSPSSTTSGYLSLNHSAPMPMIERYNATSQDALYSNTG